MPPVFQHPVTSLGSTDDGEGHHLGAVEEEDVSTEPHGDELEPEEVSGRVGDGRRGVVLAAQGWTESPLLANPAFPDDPISLSVASGNPLPDGVVLWTRLAPEPLATDGRAGMPKPSFPVHWEVAEDERCTRSSGRHPGGQA